MSAAFYLSLALIAFLAVFFPRWLTAIGVWIIALVMLGVMP